MEIDGPIELSRWEGSKENVQPLRKGRKAIDIVSKLEDTNSARDQKERLKQQMMDFEEAISAPDQEDPLIPWIRYLDWMQVVELSGFKKLEMTKLLQRATTEFKDSERYRNDLRYIHMWMEYSRLCEDPKEIFKFMEANAIGRVCAIYYETYANYLELCGDTAAAMKVYQLGIDRRAAPVEMLKKRRHEFQKRMVDLVRTQGTRSISQSTASRVANENMGVYSRTGVSGGRISLNTLTHSEASSSTRPSAQRPAAGIDRMHGAQVPKPNNSRFEVYSEAETGQETFPQWTNLASIADRAKENAGEPVPMQGQMLQLDPSRFASTSGQTPSERRALAFEVLEDA
eukprot:TRINITY_DN9686_c0_g1_i1.p1 TRINITY_DN9686_c0_g1~~TRINITY_DN9686_c0_g1_i1.p1  ORF type:complete len:343 (-),score=83.44 TRINITY_DN9686_c0_g1_i1:377-1405(-)